MICEIRFRTGWRVSFGVSEYPPWEKAGHTVLFCQVLLTDYNQPVITNLVYFYRTFPAIVVIFIKRRILTMRGDLKSHIQLGPICVNILTSAMHISPKAATGAQSGNNGIAACPGKEVESRRSPLYRSTDGSSQ